MIVYFDTSALLKLLIEEAGSDIAERLWDGAERVIGSRLVIPETAAALAAARRATRISGSRHAWAKKLMAQRHTQMNLVDPTMSLCHAASELAEVHALRGYDAVHLVSALLVREGITVATWDGDLSRAARAEGLATAGV